MERLTFHIPEDELNSSSDEFPPTSPLNAPDVERPANVVSSLCDDGKHRPVLDIDFPARLLPSSTPGHFHLYLDGLALDEGRYVFLLQALAYAGIIGKGYLTRSLERGQTIVRMPHSRKPEVAS